MKFLKSSRLEDRCLRAVGNRPRHLAIEVCESDNCAKAANVHPDLYALKENK